MTLDKLTPWAARQVGALVLHPAQALLLTGPAGLDQFEVGLALAASWLCEHPVNGVACGQCESCHLVSAHTHPDLKVLLPETEALRLGWGIDEKSASELDEKKRKPSREIRVEALRDLVDFAQRTAGRGHGKVALIYPAEAMNAVSANTLLKTLEEPPGDVRFILSSDSANRLLPTIRSRCQTHAMQWPEPSESLAWLATQGLEEPEVLFAAAGQRPRAALALAALGMDARRWTALPRALAHGDASVFESLTPAQMLDVAIKLCHDLWAVAVDAAPRFFPREALPRAAEPAAVAAWTRELLRAARTADHPWSAGLYAEALAARAREVFRAVRTRA